MPAWAPPLPGRAGLPAPRLHEERGGSAPLRFSSDLGSEGAPCPSRLWSQSWERLRGPGLQGVRPSLGPNPPHNPWKDMTILC